MKILTDFPERLQPGVTVYVGEEYLPQRIRFARPHRQGMLISFEGIHDRQQATTLRHRVVFVRTEEVPSLPEGEYYHHQLLGLQVCSEDGQQLGCLVEILETGANDVYLVRGEGGEEFLLPAIEEVVREVNLSEGIMRVHLLPGL
jgi:16S rRNA processing protein RimM